METEIGPYGITHRSFRSDLRSGQRRIEIRTTWVRERKLGQGGFGVVWLEREQRSGDVRAVKSIPEMNVNAREVDVLIDLQDVRSVVYGGRGVAW